jgi:hypothetical protein
MKSIAYAEGKLSAKMGEPERVATEKNQPVKYDVEDVDLKINSSHLTSVTKKSAEDLGDGDRKDDDSIAD